MNIRTGDLDVLFSGTVIAIENEPIIFEFPKENASLKFIVNFISDSSSNKSEIRTNPLDGKTLEIMFVNFSSSLGTGNTKTWEIGFLHDKKLFFNYRVYSIKGISKTLHYTFYLGKEGSHVR